jgi:mono/diheme cytochrome c family protein
MLRWCASPGREPSRRTSLPSFPFLLFFLFLPSLFPSAAAQASTFPEPTRQFVENRCIDCHDADTKKGELDLDALLSAPLDEKTFAKWVRVHDRVRDGEMPPKKEKQPTDAERTTFLAGVNATLVTDELARRAANGRSTFRRLNRTEYENTLRDLFQLPGLAVRDLLPEDGRADGYDKVGAGLDISHVQLSKYIEAAEKTLNTAIATQPERPPLFQERLYPGDQYSIKIALTGGDAVCLKDLQYDPSVIPEPPRAKLDKGLRQFEQEKLFPYKGTVGIFRHDDDAFHADFARFAPIQPGMYRVRMSIWSFHWEKGQVQPSTRTEVASLNASDRGVLGYFDAPSLKPTEYETVVWLNRGESLVFNAASLIPRRVGEEKGRAAEAVTQGIAIDWLDVEGPLLDSWPTAAHQRLFADLPLTQFDRKSDLKAPPRIPQGQRPPASWPNYKFDYPNQPVWTVTSKDPEADAEKLLRDFLPRVFRRPVAAEEVARYVGLVHDRLAQKVTFEEAMRTACEAALCAPDFLFLREPRGPLDDYALASRLSYFLWDSMPDAELLQQAAAGHLHNPATLRAETERLLRDPKADRFVADFTNQWLDLRDLDLTSPDKKLYPEFHPILRDAMPEETRAFFREMLVNDLPVRNVVRSKFAMINQRLAELYGIEGVSGSAIRKVALPDDSERGGLLTQAAVLKVTANGTTTSPVKRGAWVMRKILGQPPQPPPPSVPSVEPDISGATTIRAQLEKHRSDHVCAACHAKIDPAGLALESYDVIGGWRDRYRSVEKGDPAETPPGARNISFKLGLGVDPSGQLADGRTFSNIDDLEKCLLANERQLARNLAGQLITYATGAAPTFADRAEIERILDAISKSSYGARSLLHAVVESRLFLNK